jgi:hypothetical protein
MKCAGCWRELTGRQKKWHSDACKNEFYTNARRKGAAKGKAHFVAVIGNPRLEPLLMALMARKVMTSAELQAVNGSMAIATDLSNIRKFYPQVSKAKYLKTENGRRVFEYRWGVI